MRRSCRREAAYLEGPNCDEDRAFWREVLDALPPPLPWPRDSRPAQAPLQTVGFSLPEAESELLRQYCRKHTVTPLAVVLAVWSEVVARSCGQRDIVLGTPVSLRDDASREIAGHQINMLPLRLQADIGTSFEARVIDARDRLLDGLDHRRLPLAEILADHRAPAVSDRHPLFQSAVALQAPKLWPAWSGLYLAQSGEDSVKDEWAGLNLRPRGLDQQMGQIDAMLEGIDTGRVLRFVLKADCAQVSHALAQSMAAVFRRLIAAALRHPERALGGLEASAEAKAGLILPPYGQVLAPHQPSYPEVFAAVAAIAPEKAAVICGAQRLSYRELDRRSAALAERIADHAAGSGRRVAVCLRPSVDAVVAMLAVMAQGRLMCRCTPTHRRGGSHRSFPPARSCWRLRIGTTDRGCPNRPHVLHRGPKTSCPIPSGRPRIPMPWPIPCSRRDRPGCRKASMSVTRHWLRCWMRCDAA